MQRTFTNGYNYQILQRSDDGSYFVTTIVTTNNRIRSKKDEVTILAEYGLTPDNAVLKEIGVNTITYEFDDELVKKYGKIIKRNNEKVEE